MEKLIKCKSCGNEISKSAKSCPGCGAKNKKPFYKKWWIWAIIVVFVIAISGVGGGSDSDTNKPTEVDNEKTITYEAKVDNEETITYEAVDLNDMFESLKNNALKAETEYQNKYVEITGKICNFDSDGEYIGVEPVNAGELNFDSVMCYIKNDNQKNFLLEKNKGDIITIRGKVKSVGEVLGYHIDINEVQ